MWQSERTPRSCRHIRFCWPQYGELLTTCNMHEQRGELHEIDKSTSDLRVSAHSTLNTRNINFRA